MSALGNGGGCDQGCAGVDSKWIGMCFEIDGERALVSRCIFC